MIQWIPVGRYLKGLDAHDKIITCVMCFTKFQSHQPTETTTRKCQYTLQDILI